MLHMAKWILSLIWLEAENAEMMHYVNTIFFLISILLNKENSN